MRFAARMARRGSSSSIAGSMPQPVPRFYPNLVTTRAPRPTPPSSASGSHPAEFATCPAAGRSRTASTRSILRRWASICCSRRGGSARQPMPDLATRSRLALGRAAEGNRLLPPALFADPDFAMFTGSRDGEVVAGGTLYRAETCRGLSAMSSPRPPTPSPSGPTSQPLAAVTFPGLPLVGYEFGGDLVAALECRLRGRAIPCASGLVPSKARASSRRLRAPAQHMRRRRRGDGDRRLVLGRAAARSRVNADEAARRARPRHRGGRRSTGQPACGAMHADLVRAAGLGLELEPGHARARGPAPVARERRSGPCRRPSPTSRSCVLSLSRFLSNTPSLAGGAPCDDGPIGLLGVAA